LGEPLQRSLEIHPEMGVLAAVGDDLVVQLFGVAILVAAEPHERLARGDSADPPPETAVLAVLPDAATDLEERLLEHVLRVLRRPANAAAEVVHRDLEGAIERFE